MAEDDQLTAPYGSFETTKNALQGFVEGVPPRIDRSAFPGLAWNAISRLINGLRFLGLIDADGTPRPALHALAGVEDEEARKAALARVLRDSYPALFALDLARVTPAHLAEVLGQAYDVSGDTREKAVRFFVSAAMYVGIPMSPLLARDRARRPGGARRVRPTPARPKPIDQPHPSPPASGATRTIHLESGGTLTVTAAVDFLTLGASDRTFVFDVIDKLTTYASEHGAEED